MPLPVSAIPRAPHENEPANASYPSRETLALLAGRRSVKIAQLGEPGPSEEELKALLELAARAPDHGKLGPWRFVLITGDARARAGEKLSATIAGDDGVDATQLQFAQRHFLRAPVCVMVVSSPTASIKVPEWEQQLSAAAVCYGLLISAHAFGYGGCWLSEWPAYDVRARAALGMGETERVAGFVYLGTAREPPTERVRPDLAARISRF